MTKRKSKPKSCQEPQPVQIVIEFQGPGVSDPSVTFAKDITSGQIRDAAFLLAAMAEHHVHEMMQQQRIKQMQSKIIVPGMGMGPVGAGGLPS